MEKEAVQKDMSLSQEIIKKYNTHPEILGGKKIGSYKIISISC